MKPVLDEGRLPRRQADVLAFIRAYLRRQGYAPTIREIGDALGMRSTNGVKEHLVALVRKGFLRRGPKGTTRALTLTTPLPCTRCGAAAVGMMESGAGTAPREPTMSEQEAAVLEALSTTHGTHEDVHRALAAGGHADADTHALAVHPLLRDMEVKGWLVSRVAGPVPSQGLPARVLYSVTEAGQRALTAHWAPLPGGPGVYREG